VRLYILISFCITVLGLVLDAAMLIAEKYPETKTTTVSTVVGRNLLRIGLLAWMGILLFVNR
jgi:hypothetical protein